MTTDLPMLPRDFDLAQLLASTIADVCRDAPWYGLLKFSDGLPEVVVSDEGDRWSAIVFCLPEMVDSLLDDEACRIMAALVPPGKIRSLSLQAWNFRIATCEVR